MWDPHLSENTLSSAQKHDQDPSLPHTQMGRTQASMCLWAPKIHSIDMYVYIYILYIDCI